MSQKKRLEILRCVGLLKVFFLKNAALWFKKLGHFLAAYHLTRQRIARKHQPPIPRRFFTAVFLSLPCRQLTAFSLARQ
jgi:hypothetical protein